MSIKIDIKEEFKELFQEAFRVSQDAGMIIEESLKDVVNNPFSREDAEELLTAVITKIKDSARERGDNSTAQELEKNMHRLVEQALLARESILRRQLSNSSQKVLELQPFNGVKPGPVHPRPTFHRYEVPMNCGGVKTTDILLWENNERLDIHVNQFRHVNGRGPTASELLDIMLSRMPLQGLAGKDQFKIEELARSIANNGVRKPPIIARDGTLLDGNRRVAACYYILNSDDFDSEQKKRAENVFVWQLTEHATEDDKSAVVVSLNFEPDSKQDWPEYVKAKIIYGEWQAMLARETNSPGAPRMAQMKRDLSAQFGYGNDPYMVNRYIKMVEWATDFEEHLVNDKSRNEYEVKHQASKYFQYFDELSKGTTPGGVAYTLGQNEGYKHLVFDLLFQGKFKNFTLIRNLKFHNDDVVDALIKARDTNDVETAQDDIEIKLNEAKAQMKESRIGNPNQRIEIFSKWLEALPISAFRDSILPGNLVKLQKALELVNKQIGDLNIQ